jgi:mRNA-degrading endonuclease RelE of RelBE toxin-antitoxin system
MPWSILWTDQALRDMTRIDPPIAKRIARKLEDAAGDLVRYFTRFVASDEHKLRIGDNRLLAALDRDSQTILVERVDHRSRIYGRK